MSEEKPHFSSKHLKTFRTKNKGKSSDTSKKNQWSVNEEKIDEGLSAIYKNEQGELPDMKKITIKKTNPLLKILFTFLALGTCASLAIWVWLFWFPHQSNSNENQLAIEISSPAEVNFGDLITYTITYENTQNIALQNASLSIRFPEGFIFTTSSLPTKNTGHSEIDLGTIPSYHKDSLTISGKLYGTNNQKKSWRLFFGFQPANTQTPLQQVSIFENTVINSPLELTITGPTKTSAETETEFTFTFKNNLPQALPASSTLELIPRLPDNFTITSATPALDQINHWRLTTASSTKESAYKIKGKFNTNSEKTTSLKAELSILPPGTTQPVQLADANFDIAIGKSDSSLALVINGSNTSDVETAPGQNVTLSIPVKNTTSESMKDISVQLALDAPSLNKQSIFNWPKIVDKYNGDIHGEQLSTSVRHGQITWTKKHTPQLAELKPNDEVIIEITLPVKDEKSFDLQNVSEYKATVTGAINFSDSSGKELTLTSPSRTIIFNSDLAFESREAVSTNEQNKEEHALTWVLTNTFHDLKNIQLSAEVYGDVSFKQVSNSPAGTATFDEKNKKITWTINELPNSVDVVAWPFILTLNTKNTTQNTLVSKVTIEADDTVTGKRLKVTGPEIPLKQ